MGTILFGFLILFFLWKNKLYEKIGEKFDNNNNNCNEENRLEIKNNKISDDDTNKFNSSDNICLLNINKSFNSSVNVFKKSHIEINDLNNDIGKVDIIWVKYKIFTLVYLSLFLITFHFLKFVRIFYSEIFIEKINMANNSNIDDDNNKMNINYLWVVFLTFSDFLISILPYMIYLLNAFFYLLNYGILKNSESIL